VAFCHRPVLHCFTTIIFLVDLPLSYYLGFVRQHAYGLSNQTFDKWAQDEVTGLLIGTVVGILFLWVPYLLLSKRPRRWWLYTGLLAIPFIVLVSLVQPIWIDPLFNTFGPMKDKALEADILRLAERAGIEGSRAFEVAKSEDTNAINAYVAGFGTTKRIVLWDTILAKLNREQLLVIMGHEMGHYVLGHTWKLILSLSALIIAALYAVHRTSGWLIARNRHRFGFSELSSGLPAAHPGALQPRIARGDANCIGRAMPLRARSRSLRAGDHTRQPCRGHSVRDVATGEPRGAEAGAPLHLVARQSPDTRRPHRLQQRLSTVGVEPAARLRRSFQGSLADGGSQDPP
jgi:Zn-dependent protease with chaperone function